MRRKVTYHAADRKEGFTPQELRDALRRAVRLGPVVTGWNRRIRTIEVEETDPDAYIEGVS